jgi:P27 family predicted phage terminase small subunit
MTRGRRPAPTALKLIHGGRPAHAAEPTPARCADVPEPPAYLSDLARAEWQRLAPVLHTMRVLTVADLNALGMYCTAFARWQEAEVELRRVGLVVMTDNGNPVQNPFLCIANKALEQMHRFGLEFGLTPASRTKVRKAPNAGEE